MSIKPQGIELRRKLQTSVRLISIDTERSLAPAKYRCSNSDKTFERIYKNADRKLESCFQKQLDVDASPTFFSR